MLRTMLLDRPALIFVILAMPTSMAVAGPIFTHPIQPAGASRWVQGSTGVDAMAWSSIGPSGVATGQTLWVDVQSSRPGHDLFAPSRTETAASAVGNFPASPTAAGSTPVSAAPTAESSAASSPASTPFVPVTPGASGIDVSGRGVDGPSSAAPSSPSSRGFSPGQPSISPGSPSTYQASTAGLADSRSTRLAGAPTNPIAASQGPTIPATGGATTPGAARPTREPPPSPVPGFRPLRVAGGPSRSRTPVDPFRQRQSPPAPRHRRPASRVRSPRPPAPRRPSRPTARRVPRPPCQRRYQGRVRPSRRPEAPRCPVRVRSTRGSPSPRATVVPSLPQTPGIAAPTTGSAVAAPQDAGAASSISTTTATILAASSILPATNLVGQGPATPAANGASSTALSSTNIVGLSPAATTITGNAAQGGGPVVPTSNNAANSGSTITPVGTLNATSLVPITPNPTGSADPGLAVPTGQQLISAIGGSSNVSANPSVATAVLTPAPLNLTTPLPPPQVAPIAYAVPGVVAIGDGTNSAVLPQSLPEPGGLALFSAVLLASAMNMAIRRLRSRVEAGR